MNYIVSGNGTITIVIDNESFSIGYDHPNYMKIKQCVIDNDEAGIKELSDIPTAIESFAEGNVEIVNGVFLYKGVELHNTLTDRVMGMMQSGFPFKPMLSFIDNLLGNPSNRAINELYTFMENKNLPITEDGCILAYKALRKDYTDKWTGTIDNSVGKTVEMDRWQVDDNCNNGCSHGLHAGALEYVESYRIEKSEDVVVIVKINPQDVVSVPEDYNFQKMRCCKYSVVADYEGKLEEVMHKADGGVWTPEEFETFMHNMMDTAEDGTQNIEFLEEE
jgi:hypothetical protein